MKIVTLRFIIGSLILLFVDLLWVISSELTEYLYHDKQYVKPFFIAYTKSIMFTLYLFGFICYDHWWQQKNFATNDYYSFISSDSDHKNLTMDSEDSDDEESNDDDSTTNDQNAINSSMLEMEPVSNSTNSSFLSDSVWIPIKKCSDTSSLSGKSSETEDDEDETNSVSSHAHVFFDDNTSSSNLNQVLLENDSQKSNVNFIKTTKRSKANKPKKFDKKKLVRFAHLIEVKHLSDKHANDAFLSRLSYQTFMRILYQQKRQNSSDLNHKSSNAQQPILPSRDKSKLSIRQTAILAFYFTWIWFSAHLSFHMGLQYSEAGLVNVLSSTTPLFTLLLGILFPSNSMSDSLSLTKLICVLLSMLSVAMISNIQPINHSVPVSNNIPPSNSGKLNDTILPLGSIWSLCGAFFYAVYVVLMRFNLADDSMLNFPMFFGFIGLFSMIFMFPFLMLLNFTRIELFEWPTKDQWILILVNGLCGTVVSELLWLLGSFMTSSLIGTLSASFTIPMAVCFDIFYKNIEYPRIFFLGTIPMFFSFLIIIIVTQYKQWDPLLEYSNRCLWIFDDSRKFFRKNLNKLSDSNSPVNNDEEISNRNHCTNETIIDQDNTKNDSTCDSNLTKINNRRFLNGKDSITNGHDQKSIDKSETIDDYDDDDEHNEQTKSLIDSIEC